MSGRSFETFKGTVERELMRHPVVTDNAYTAWFAEGRVPLDHLRHFTVQFSVFSNQFLLAALNRVVNAGTLEAARESKEILLNELGVIYAAGGFWKELIRGLERVKAEQAPALPLAFFTWHDRLEENHREHVWHELRACHDSPAFEEGAFIAAGVEMLDAVGAFWDGLHDARPRDTGADLLATA
jgi:hypothetical protein